jgi:hypothetical protein
MSLPLRVFAIGLTCFLIFADLALFSGVTATKKGPWWPAVEFAGGTLFAAFVISAYFFEKHELSQDGIASQNFLGGRKYLRWADTRSVQYSAWMNWFRLKTSDATVGISTWLIGLPHFAQMVLSHAPPDAINDRTRQLLVAAAAGKRLQT